MDSHFNCRPFKLHIFPSNTFRQRTLRCLNSYKIDEFSSHLKRFHSKIHVHFIHNFIFLHKLRMNIYFHRWRFIRPHWMDLFLLSIDSCHYKILRKTAFIFMFMLIFPSVNKFENMSMIMCELNLFMPAQTMQKVFKPVSSHYVMVKTCTNDCYIMRLW